MEISFSFLSFIPLSYVPWTSLTIYTLITSISLYAAFKHFPDRTIQNYEYDFEKIANGEVWRLLSFIFYHQNFPSFLTSSILFLSRGLYIEHFLDNGWEVLLFFVGSIMGPLIQPLAKIPLLNTNEKINSFALGPYCGMESFLGGIIAHSYVKPNKFSTLQNIWFLFIIISSVIAHSWWIFEETKYDYPSYLGGFFFGIVVVFGFYNNPTKTLKQKLRVAVSLSLLLFYLVISKYGIDHLISLQNSTKTPVPHKEKTLIPTLLSDDTIYST